MRAPPRPPPPSRNRWIAIAVAAAIFAASAFPPFQLVYSRYATYFGYSFLLLPPYYNASPAIAGSINFGVLVIEYVAILSAGVLAWLVAPRAWLLGFGRRPT